jgi:hypothetical protein
MNGTGLLARRTIYCKLLTSLALAEPDQPTRLHTTLASN